MAAAGAAATVAPASPAAAADGDPLLLGDDTNTASTGTRLTVDGDDAPWGLSVVDTGEVREPSGGAALHAQADADTFAHGLWVDANGTATAAHLFAEAGHCLRLSHGSGGALSVFGGGGEVPAIDVLHGSDMSPGLRLSASRQLHLHPWEIPSPPEGDLDAEAGELRWTGSDDGDNALWACTGGGTPGTWQKLAGTGTAGALHVLPTPVRALDSRSSGDPLPGGYQARTVELGDAVPAGASAALVTVQLVNATAGNGNLTLWAAGRPRPPATTLVWGGDSGRHTTLAVTALDAEGRVQLASSLPTHVVLDVVGAWR